MRVMMAALTMILLSGCMANSHRSSAAADSAFSQAPPGMLDVRDFGARGDGKSDDTAAIQKAIDAAAPAHDTVFLPAGTYLCADIHLRPQTGLLAYPTFSYRANGGAILKLNNPKAKCLLDLTAASGATVEGLCLDGNNRMGANIHGVMVDKPDYGKQEDAWRLERCRINGFSGCGVFLGRIWCFSIRHCMISHNGGNGIRLRGWDGFILDNWLSGNGDAGLGAYEENASTTVTANRIEWNQKAGIEIHAGSTYNITGNYIDRAGGPGIKLMPGRLWGSDKESPCSTISITGNVIYRSGAALGGHEPDPADNCYLRFEQVDGLTCIGNTMTLGRDDNAKGVWSPQTGIRVRSLKVAVIKDNVMNDGAIKTLIDDQGQHRGEVIINDNPGTLRAVAP